MSTSRPVRIAIALTSIAMPLAAAALAGLSYSIFDDVSNASYDACLSVLATTGGTPWQCAIHAQEVAASALDASGMADWTWLALLLAGCWYLALAGTALWRWVGNGRNSE